MSATFILLLLVCAANQSYNLSIAQTLKPCPNGQVRRRGSCEKCPPGTYQDFRNKDRCIMCREGSFNPFSGGFVSDFCRRCPDNTISDRGAAKCEPCRSGFRAVGSKCVRCGPGEEIGGTSCTLCQPGTFSNSTGPDPCEECPGGRISPRGAKSVSQCTPCPPGLSIREIDRFGSGFSTMCRVCGEPYFLPAPGEACIRCPFGTIPQRRKSLTVTPSTCKPCTKNAIPEAGFFCRKCPPGTETAAPGAVFCKTTGSVECPKNYLKTSTGDCLSCPKGMRLNIDKETCESCPNGTIGLGSTSTECRRCPKGMTSDFLQENCVCSPGHFVDGDGCTPCRPGTANGGDSDRCFECFEGTFASGSGSTECKECPFGSVPNMDGGATKCMPCSSGFIPNFSNPPTECVLSSTGCPLGMRPRMEDGFFLGCEQIDCQVDTPEEEIGKSCLTCKAGQRLIRSGKCVSCPRNAVSEGGRIEICTKCPKGMLRNPFQRSECNCIGQRLEGQGLIDGECRRCPRGTFAPWTSGECKPCEKGTFTNSIGSTFCASCPLGTFSDEEGATSCKMCPKGFVPEAPSGATHCVRAA